MHTEINHPLVKHKISLLRNRATGIKEFRELTNEITMLVAYEALKHTETETVKVETPLTETTGEQIASDIFIIPILRAGIGMLHGMLTLLPNARVGFVGMYRDHETQKPVEYYENIPVPSTRPPCIMLIDPMLATGGSIIAAIDLLKRRELHNISVLSIISAPEGIACVESAHPNTPIYTAQIDERLDDNKYIIPGLGDAGDRLFGT